MSDRGFEEVLELQRALKRVCFDAEVREADLAILKDDPARFRLYREMVRLRLRELLQSAFPRTQKTLGSEDFTRVANEWLSARPPRTRYLRDAAGEFVAWAVEEWLPNASGPAHVRDLLTLEAARWECMHGATFVPATVDEFAFDRIPFVDPSARLLTLEYAVNDESTSQPARGPVYLCVHRRKADHGTELWTLNRMAHRLLSGWQSGKETAQETVARVLREDGTSADATFIDALGTVLADMIDRAIILGSH